MPESNSCDDVRITLQLRLPQKGNLYHCCHQELELSSQICKPSINDVYHSYQGVATFASNTKSHDDKGRGRQVIAYCDENKISHKQRLSELGISPWSLYYAKRMYAPKEEGENAGELLQLIPGGTFLPNPIKPSRSRCSK